MKYLLAVYISCFYIIASNGHAQRFLCLSKKFFIHIMSRPFRYYDGVLSSGVCFPHFGFVTRITYGYISRTLKKRFI